MSEDYRQLSALLDRVRRRLLAMKAMRVWTRTGAALAVVSLAALLSDRLLSPEGLMLVALWSAVVGVAAAACGAALVIALRRTPGQRQIARFVEERCPEMEDALVTAMTEHERNPSHPMLAAVFGDAIRRVESLDLDRVVSRTLLRRSALMTAAATLALVAIGGASLAPALRAARVLRAYASPSSVMLQVAPGSVKVRAGDSLRVVARMPGVGGGVNGITPVIRIVDGDESHDVRMAPDSESGAFALTFDKVEKGFTYLVTAAGASSPEYAVAVVIPPHVQRIDLRYEFPAGFGLKPRIEEDGGDIYAPAGTRVRLTVTTDKPVTAAALTLADGARVPFVNADGRLEAELQIADDNSYRIALNDADGLTNPGETEYFIRTLADAPPDVRIVHPAADRAVTPLEEVPIEARASDDFGIAAFDLVFSIRGGVERAIPFNTDGQGVTVTGGRMIYLEDLNVEPGDFVAYYARARDRGRGRQSTEARSDIFFLEVKPFEEEFVAAASLSSGTGADRSLDGLIAAEKDIIVATWKLDARGQNARARSENDVRAVARAQGELRLRTQSARARGQSVGALANAADAMGRAQQQLDAIKTTEALPHEMTALNELLKAQADIRRTQVQQGQDPENEGGLSRQGQDLSTLFDRELTRQQTTNYRTPTSAAALDREVEERAAAAIRELARRQDALIREQLELARKQAQINEEELRRQLDRLTRQQTELRREVEELARQEDQRPRRPAARQVDNNRALQQASEEMQKAANDLRRRDPNQASTRGTRAVERLRELEQRLRVTQPDADRALGQLRLEARQIAEAQRQLATEPRQAATADAARRRGNEQDRLADRTQRLEQRIREAAPSLQDTDEQERQAMMAAAREVDRQKVSPRMRAAANAARAQAGSYAREAQEIARSLDRISDSLNTAGGDGQSEALAEQLERTRNLRNQLAAAERQVEEMKRQVESAGSGPPPNAVTGWEEARDLLEQMRGGQGGMGTPLTGASGFNPGMSAAGTEDFKQDFTRWDQLKQQIGAALERREASLAAQLRARAARDRLSAGGTQSVPQEYRSLVDKYYEALARDRK